MSNKPSRTPEEARLYAAEYRKRFPKAVKEYNRKYKAAKKDKIREYNKQYYLKRKKETSLVQAGNYIKGSDPELDYILGLTDIKPEGY